MPSSFSNCLPHPLPPIWTTCTLQFPTDISALIRLPPMEISAHFRLSTNQEQKLPAGPSFSKLESFLCWPSTKTYNVNISKLTVLNDLSLDFSNGMSPDMFSGWVSTFKEQYFAIEVCMTIKHLRVIDILETFLYCSFASLETGQRY